MIRTIRTHLAWKVFLTYIAVILVALVVLVISTNFTVPQAYINHMAGMGGMMSGENLTSMTQTELFSGYQAAVTEAITLAAAAALIAAVIASLIISRQVVEPVRRMMDISHDVAEGEYRKRLSLAGDIDSGQFDELDQLALSFNQMANKLEKTEAIRRQMIGDISHELRTPLTAIKGTMEGLEDGVLPATPETYQMVYREADRLQRLVNGLQELSRVEAGAYQLKLEPVAVLDLVETVTAHLKRQFEEKDIHLEVKIPADIPAMDADKDRITQVLTNLAGNALQYTPSGGQVTILARKSQDDIEIAVKDTGIGISAFHLHHVFDRFYRADKSRTRPGGGSGIGLTIAQALVKAHSGHIWVESGGEGKGSTFHFTIPIARN